MRVLLKGWPLIRKGSLTAKNIAVAVVKFALDKKAEDIVILDMKRIVNFCDYFVICSGNTDRHLNAIAERVDEGLEKIGINAHWKKGMRDANWIVFDTGDVIIHIFEKKIREFYGLEHLWQEAKRVNWNKKK